MSKPTEEAIEKLKEALRIRSKQIGVACLKHDLTHSLKCGHCYKDLEQQNKRLREALEGAAMYWKLPEEGVKHPAIYEAWKLVQQALEYKEHE